MGFGDDWFDASVVAMLVMMGMFMDTAKECIVNGADESSVGQNVRMSECHRSTVKLKQSPD